MAPAMAAVDFLEPAEEENGGGGAGGAEEKEKEQPPLKLPKLPHATQGIVEDDPLQNINYLTKNRVYSKMGTNGVLDAIPSVMHYGGFELKRVHKQTLRICNVAGYSTRCHIIPPTTPYFKISSTEKRGFMAPGMSESLTVEFCPTEHRYYYDCIRVHSEEANLLIPLHAYPVMNEVKFPSRIDFGRCQVGELHVKEVNITCKVPIDFEYEIRARGGDGDLQFEVDGMEGTVPANGIATVTIQYQPSKLATASMELELRVSEFGSSPVVCQVTGSGFPGVARDREIERVTGKANPEIEELYGMKPVSERAFGTVTGAGGGDGRGGAGGGDAYTRAMQDVRRRRKIAEGTWQKPTEVRRAALPPPPEEFMIDGLYVPADLGTTHAVSYVLNQTAGKLRIQDIQTMIDEKNREAALREGRLEEALTMTQGQSSNVVLDPLDDLGLGDDVREGMFLMQLQEAETHRRRMEMGFTMMSIGEDLLSDEHCASVKQARVDHYLIQNHRQEQEHACLEEAVLEEGSLLMVKAGDEELEPVSTANRWEPERLGGEIEAVDGLEEQEPSWNPYDSDDWLKKAQSLERLVAAARRVIVQNRAQKRLNSLQGLLRSCGRDKSKVQMLVSQELMAASSTSLTRPGLPPAQLFKPQKLCPAPLPVFRKNLFKDRAPVDPNYVADFDIVDKLVIKVPLKFQLLGYDNEPWGAIPSYIPPLLDQPLLAGAEEESGGAPVPAAVVPAPGEFPSMPFCFAETPYESNPIAGRYTDDTLMSAPVTSWGVADANRIQPAMFAHEDTTETHDVASNCCRALRGTPLLSDNWLPRREYWQVMPVEVPELMLGADQRDVLPEDKDDLRRPPVKPHVPTEAEVEGFLVSASGVAAEEGAAAAAAVPEKGGGKGGKGGKEKEKDAGKGAKPATPVDEGADKGVRVDETREQQVSKDIPRRLKEAELEAAMLERRRALVDDLDKRVEAYNADLRMPCYFKLKF